MNSDTKTKLKLLLSEYIGVEPSDLDENDTFADDLHMSLAEIFDFLETLRNQGVDTSSVNIEEIETLGDLIDALELHQ